MRKSFLNVIRISSLLILTFVTSFCEKNLQSSSTQEASILHKVKVFGLNEGNISITNKTIQVDDMIFDKNQLLSTIKNIENMKGFEKKEYKALYLVKKPIIHVYGDNLIPFVEDGLNFAINEYNTLDLNIKFKRVYNPSIADITVYMKSGINGLGQAQFPDGYGNPGSIIQINTDVLNKSGTSNNLIKSLILHELGHTIGLRHSDWKNRKSCITFGEEDSRKDWNVNTNTNLNSDTANYGTYYIWKTPTSTDDDSFMRACIDGRTPRFTGDDVATLNQLYGQ